MGLWQKHPTSAVAQFVNNMHKKKVQFRDSTKVWQNQDSLRSYEELIGDILEMSHGSTSSVVNGFLLRSAIQLGYTMNVDTMESMFRRGIVLLPFSENDVARWQALFRMDWQRIEGERFSNELLRDRTSSNSSDDTIECEEDRVQHDNTQLLCTIVNSCIGLGDYQFTTHDIQILQSSMDL